MLKLSFESNKCFEINTGKNSTKDSIFFFFFIFFQNFIKSHLIDLNLIDNPRNIQW